MGQAGGPQSEGRRFEESPAPCPQVPRRAWHRGAPDLSVLGVGCGRAGSLNNLTPVAEIRRTLAKALDYGINLFDTADIYGQGDSERMIAAVLRGRQDKAFVITKVGMAFSNRARLAALLKPALRLGVRYSSSLRKVFLKARDGAVSQDFRPERLKEAVEGCLRRLERERLDALLLHDPPVSVLQDPAIGDFLKSLRQAGKVAYYGASVGSMQEVEAALTIDGLSLLQVDRTLAAALAVNPVGQAVRQRRIGLVVRQVLRPGLEPAAASIRSVLDLPGVTSAAVGMSTRAHLDDAVKGASADND